jgi:hypothetical protein
MTRGVVPERQAFQAEIQDNNNVITAQKDLGSELSVMLPYAGSGDPKEEGKYKQFWNVSTGTPLQYNHCRRLSKGIGCRMKQSTSSSCSGGDSSFGM